MQSDANLRYTDQVLTNWTNSAGRPITTGQLIFRTATYVATTAFMLACAWVFLVAVFVS